MPTDNQLIALVVICGGLATLTRGDTDAEMASDDAPGDDPYARAHKNIKRGCSTKWASQWRPRSEWYSTWKEFLTASVDCCSSVSPNSFVSTCLREVHFRTDQMTVWVKLLSVDYGETQWVADNQHLINKPRQLPVYRPTARVSMSHTTSK